MIECRADFETRSARNLKTEGQGVYFESPHFRPLGLTIEWPWIVTGEAVDNVKQRGDRIDWEWGQPCPEKFRRHVEGGGLIRAWNAQFERQCLDWLAANQGWPRPAIEQYRCSAAEAAALGLPRSLDAAGAALSVTTRKDKRGEALIRKFSIPRKPRVGEDPNGVYFNEPHEFPAEYAEFVEYRQQDVRAEGAIAERLIPLSDYEWQVYALDQRINSRGIRIDVRSARAALRLADKTKILLDKEMAQVTGGRVRKCSEVAKLVEWTQSQGVGMSTAGKADILDLLALDDIPQHVRTALELRQEAGKTSVSKLQAMLSRANTDERVRHSFIYHKATTGRWQSVGVNFANLPRPRKEYENAHLDTAALFDAFRAEDPEWLRALYGPALGRPLDLISDAIRGFLWAAPGREFVQADYSGIEGCVIAWSSGEDWKVKAMHEIFADPSLPDMYRRTAAQIMNTTTDVITKKHPLRQSVGKVSELACFRGDTKVITRNGVKNIVEITPDDLLWDGVEWVTNSGLIAKGARQVVDVAGIGVTPDHLILAGETWMPARELVLNDELRSRALATASASLLSQASKRGRLAESVRSWSLAPVVYLPTELLFPTCGRAPALAAGTALKKRRGKRERVISATMTSFPTKPIGPDFSIASRHASTDAPTQTIVDFLTTEVAASVFSGDLTDEHFWPTSSPLKAGTSRLLSSTALKSTGITSPEISGLLLAPSMPGIDERPRPSKPACSNSSESCETYDLLEVGPRNRFTIVSTEGPLIVHNCGFGGGVSAFYSMSRNYNVDLDALYAPTWEYADPERRERAVKRYENSLKRGISRTDELSRNAWIACEIIKVGWRANNPAIAAGWRLREEAVREAIRAPGTVTRALKFKYIVAQGYLWCRLPSGRCLAYASPKLRDQVWAKILLNDGTWSDSEVMDREQAEKQALVGKVRIEGTTSPSISALGLDKSGKKMVREHLYGGLFAENDTQAIARDLLVNGMFKAEAAGYPIVGHVYDEMFAEVPAGFGDLRAFEELICELPGWAEGLPLMAGGWVGKRYRKD